MADDDNEQDNEWEERWNERMQALEKVLGKSDDKVFHGVIPFFMGVEVGGAADVVSFSRHLDGNVYVTSELIGNEDQIQNDLGNYELMLCLRKAADWAPNLLSRLAYATLESNLNPGDTMDIGPAMPKGSTIEALLFTDYARFSINENQCGLLLCLGITGDELNYCRSKGSELILKKLKDEKVYPFTDLKRKSVLR